MLRRLLGPVAAVMAGLLIIAGAVGLATPREAAAQEEAEIEATVQAIENAWNSRSAFTFRDFFTDEGFESEFGFPRSDVQELMGFIGDPPVTATATNIVVTDGTATADISLEFSDAFSENAQWTFVLTSGQWLVDQTVTIIPEVPEGATVIDVQLDEYEFIFDPAAIEAGESVAFAIENVGQEAHEFVLFRLTTDAPLLDLLEVEGEPEGIEFIAAAEAEPGESNIVLPPGPLTDGRYGVVCFFPSADGTPHAFLGMVSEFNVGQGGGTVAPISPPNTGDGGIAGLQSSQSFNLAAILAGLVGLLGLAVIGRSSVQKDASL